MKYARAISVICENCGVELPIRDGDTITREAWGREAQDAPRKAVPAGENGQPVPVQAALWFALDNGWTALTERDVDGTFRRIRSFEELAGIKSRNLTVICASCDGEVVPRLSRAAQRAIEDASESERSLLERIARLEGQVAVLTAREVAS